MDRAERLKYFGARLKNAREDKGFRYAKDFAQAISISPQYLSGIERGYSNSDRPATAPDDDLLENMAAALGLPVTTLHSWLGRIPEEDFDPLERLITKAAYNHDTNDDLTPDQIRDIKAQAAAYVDGLIDGLKRKPKDG